MNRDTNLLKPEWVDASKAFPHPHWDRVAAWLETAFPEDQWDAAWTTVAREWALHLTKAVGPGQQLFDSPHFLLSATVREAKANEVLQFLESTYRRIRQAMPFIDDEGMLYGKCLVLIFGDTHRFYEYLSDFMEEEGEFGTAGGVYLNRGYGHFAMPSDDLTRYTDVLSHELSHAMVSHLDLPPWLNEAIAMTVEDSITCRNPYILDREMIRRHRDYWTSERMQAFWKGDSFMFPDEGQELSYHLALFLFAALLAGGETPTEDVQAFILRAKYRDAGASAFEDVFGLPIEEAFSQLLGQGDWKPRNYGLKMEENSNNRRA